MTGASKLFIAAATVLAITVARAYADNTERLATAFDSLYASLSDTQKEAADMLFRQQTRATAQHRTRR
jgi:hypothetical protein